MTVVDDAGVTPLTLNVTRSLRYREERWWKVLCMVVATLKICGILLEDNEVILTYSPLTMLVGRQEEHPACKN